MAPHLTLGRKDAKGEEIFPHYAPKDILGVATYLRNSKASGLRKREGIFNGNRVDFFKGKLSAVSIDCCGNRAVRALLRPEFKKNPNHPLVTNEEEAETLLRRLMENHNFYYRVQKSEHRTLELFPRQTFELDGYYAWQWETPASRLKSTLISALLIGMVLAFVLFPLWPMSLRVGIWYLSLASMGLVIALFGIAIIRLIIFAITFIFPWTRPGIWMFPNFFADVGIIDSFIPFYGWHGTNYEMMHKQKYARQVVEKQNRKKQKKHLARVSKSTPGKVALDIKNE